MGENFRDARPRRLLGGTSESREKVRARERESGHAAHLFGEAATVCACAAEAEAAWALTPRHANWHAGEGRRAPATALGEREERVSGRGEATDALHNNIVRTPNTPRGRGICDPALARDRRHRLAIAVQQALVATVAPISTLTARPTT